MTTYVIAHCTTQYSKKDNKRSDKNYMQILRQHRLWTAPFAGNEQKKKENDSFG